MHRRQCCRRDDEDVNDVISISWRQRLQDDVNILTTTQRRRVIVGIIVMTLTSTQRRWRRHRRGVVTTTKRRQQRHDDMDVLRTISTTMRHIHDAAVFNFVVVLWRRRRDDIALSSTSLSRRCYRHDDKDIDTVARHRYNVVESIRLSSGTSSLTNDDGRHGVFPICWNPIRWN